MSPTSSFMTRRRGLADSVDLNRDRSSLMRRSRSIGGVRNVTRDETGKRVAMPTSAQISGGTAPSSFYKSMAPTRADRVRASMADGSFSGIRSKFNESNAGKQVMDADGTIRAHNPYRDGGQLGGSQTVTAPTPSAQPTPPATATKPQQQPAGPPVPGAKPGESLARTGVIRDETGDVTDRIRASMAGTSTTTKPAAPANPVADQALKQATALRDATAGADSATKLVAATQTLLNKSRAAVAAPQAVKSPTATTAQVPTKPAVPAKPVVTPDRNIDAAISEGRGFDKPDNSAPGNIEYRPLPKKEADNIRAIAGRGDDGVARALQVFNPLRTFSTLKQGGKSALPATMGPQPTYANANDRLKGDSDAIKSARDNGLLRTRKVTDRFGETQTQVAVPMVRGTDKPAEIWKSRAPKRY